MLRDAVAALSLANLVFLRSWDFLFAKSASTGYWSQFGSPPIEFTATLISEILLACLLFAVFRVIRKQSQLPAKERSRALRFGTGVFFTAIIVILFLSAIVTLSSSASPSFAMAFVRRAVIVLGLLGGVLFVITYMTGRWMVLRHLLQLLVVASPLALMFAGTGAMHAIHYNPAAYANGQMAPKLNPPPNAPHVLWVVFDEWDEDLSFHDRPASLRMPEMDRLRGEAFVSDNVETPGTRTDVSMPALITGRVVTDYRQLSVRKMELITPQGFVVWNDTPTVFSDIRQAGLNTAVLAWGIPYCRLFPGSLSECDWVLDSSHEHEESLPALIGRRWRGLLETQFRSILGQSLGTSDHAWAYHRIMEKVQREIPQQRNNLTLLHMPVPHPPFFYNAKARRDDYGAEPFSFLHSAAKGYVDMLALVDLTLGQLRHAMEAAGKWDSTTVLLTADHPDRSRTNVDGKPIGHTVPFILKLAGQHENFLYDRPFSALLTRQLFNAILKREISTPQEVAGWLDKHSGDFPVSHQPQNPISARP